MRKRELIDELEDIVYISDPETHEVIFINAVGCRTLGIAGDSYVGEKCYEVIQGLDAPCPFCTNDQLTADEFYIWEFTNPKLQRHYLLKDKFIELNKKKARFEIAVDITEKENVSKAVREKLEVEEILVSCIRRLTAATSLDEAVEMVIKAVGEYYNADRSYIFEIDGTRNIANNTYEWCREGVKPEKENLQEVPLMTMSFWFEQMEEQGCFAFSDLEMIRETAPDEYHFLKAQGINSLMVVPMGEKGNYFGYIGVDNPDEEKELLLLQSLAYFIINEITKRRNQMKLEYIGYHDALTGLYNRYQYTECLKALESEPLESVGIASVDINGLKSINEDYGHVYGNDVLVETADVLRRCLESDQIYRLSGDEFVFIDKNLSREAFFAKIDRARDAFKTDGVSSVAIGCTWEDTDINIHLLIQHADELMFVDKQEYYKQTVNKAKHHNPELLEGLLRSLRNREFEMFLQPKGELENVKVIGAEALVRHRHPEKGIIPPDKFIPLLEKEHIIKYIDLFIFDEVCSTLDRWKRQGVPLIPISLNFSRVTMMEKDLIKEISDIYSRYDFSAKFIEIEVTETVGEMEQATVAEISENIKSLGFGISLDDFGTKYSSIAVLTIMDLDMIKLDRSLISTLADNAKNRIIVGHTIEICHEMNIKCIAEGVETREQLEILKELGCDWLQGYLLSKPVTLSEFEEKFL